MIWSDLTLPQQQRALASEDVTEIWGIGKNIAKKLQEQDIHTALDFIKGHTPTLRKQLGVTVERTQREMQGFDCKEDVHTDTKQNLIRSRSFGQMVTDLASLEAAISHHISSGAKKIREQQTQAHVIGVFIFTIQFRQDLTQYQGYHHIALPQATNDTITLNHVAQTILKKIFKEGYEYKKCGIELSGIESIIQFTQNDLFIEQSHITQSDRMKTWDMITKKYGASSLQLGSELLSKKWLMTRNQLSPCYTTKWTDLCIVN